MSAQLDLLNRHLLLHSTESDVSYNNLEFILDSLEKQIEFSNERIRTMKPTEPIIGISEQKLNGLLKRDGRLSGQGGVHPEYTVDDQSQGSEMDEEEDEEDEEDEEEEDSDEMTRTRDGSVETDDDEANYVGALEESDDEREFV